MTLRRIAVASRTLRGLGRALFDRERRGELALRLADYVEYDQFLDATIRERVGRLDSSVVDTASAAAGPLLVTTNAGLFLFSAGRWHCLFPAACFGIAVSGPDLYLGASAGLHSFVLHGKLEVGSSQYRIGQQRILAKFETRYHNERIHQIAYDPLTASVVCANTRRTSLLTIDPKMGGLLKEEFLFEDATGFPVHTDQAHLNSVTPHGRALLFAMHNAGNHGSALGFVLDGRVRAYSYPVRGVHDIVVHDDALMFTDSFRADQFGSRPDVSGAIRYRGHEYLADQTDAVRRKLVLRGLAIRDGVLAVGYSFYAKRESRLTETAGGILTLKDGSLVAMADGPFSQVYDVLPIDGMRTDRAGPARTADVLHRMFERDVGPLTYDRSIPSAGLISKLR